MKREAAPVENNYDGNYDPDEDVYEPPTEEELAAMRALSQALAKQEAIWKAIGARIKLDNDPVEELGRTK